MDITTYLAFPIDPADVPLDVNNSTLSQFKLFRAKVAVLRNLIRNKRSLLEKERTDRLIKEFEDDRCANFAANKAAFIASSLNRSKRCIVLDRAMSTNHNQERVLVTDPVEVKKIAAEHFRTIAGIPSSAPLQVEDMSDRWQCAYMPDDTIDPLIYQDLLAPPSDDEWKETINSLPNNKAVSTSRIPYELFKHLSKDASLYLKLLVTECFNTSEILSQWKDAT